MLRRDVSFTNKMAKLACDANITSLLMVTCLARLHWDEQTSQIELGSLESIVMQ